MRTILFITFMMGMFFCGASYSQGTDLLHVKSPEWKDQVIYFILTDRFEDGDTRNNDQGAGEYDRNNEQKYSGGDIKGVIKRIPYLKELGVTAVWITPVVANQWWDPWSKNAGYHGYWAENFKKVDKHLGDIEVYKELSRELHKNGMYLIQDVVCNHVGNFFRYNGKYDPNNVAVNFEINTGSRPVTEPSQYPFNLNDARVAEQRAMNIYNWTPNITDYNDIDQKSRYQMSDLDDLNTRNPLVRDELLSSFKYWIENVGVDAFRVDTATYVEHDFWAFFNPGIEAFAKGLGKDDFLIFAETWFNAEPYKEKGDRDTARYLGTSRRPEFNSVINFPMQNDVERVFGRGAPTAYLSYRIKSLYKNYKRPERLVNFIDNHDMSRFLASYKKDSLTQALTFIMTIPGVPSIYYGTEQGFESTRASMFSKGVGSNGRDHFITNSEYFKLIRSLISLRKSKSCFRNGKINVLRDSINEAGVFAYKIEDDFCSALVLFNTASFPVLMDHLDTGAKEGRVLESVFSHNSASGDILVGEKGFVSRILPAHSTGVFILDGDKSGNAEKVDNIPLSGFKRSRRVEKNFIIGGTYKDKKGECKLSLVVDGNLKDTVSVHQLKGGDWKVEVPVDNLDNGDHFITALASKKGGTVCAVSDRYEFDVDRPYVLVMDKDDPEGDDKGPKGTYLYPTHETFKGQMDIKNVKVYRSGNNIKLKIKMRNPLTNSWNPKNGFDHVTFAVYLDVPGGPCKVSHMPYQNSLLPNGMKWNFMAYMAGWANAFYSSKGSSTKSFGTPVNPGPDVSVDRKDNSVIVIIPAKAIGSPKTLKGLKMYISTWDYDGLESKYRPLGPLPEPFGFGGGDKKAPLIMDDIGFSCNI